MCESRRRVWALACALSLPGLIAGCNPVVVSGLVLDVQGRPLPGVAVSVEGTPNQDLTDALGEYRVPYAAGHVTLSFVKTGFTSGRLELEASGYQPVSAAPVQLWRLPPSKGLFLFKEGLYTPLRVVEPEPVPTSKEGVVFALKAIAPTPIEDSRPLLLAYKTSQYETRLRRLEKRPLDVTPTTKDADKTEVWAPVDTVILGTSPIDEPERQLLQLQYGDELPAGVYAVDWGGFDGKREIESGRAYLFQTGVTAPIEDSTEDLGAILEPLEAAP